MGDTLKTPQESGEENYPDWREIDPEALLHNPTYIALHERHEGRNERVNNAFSLKGGERERVLNSIFEEEEQDEAEHLKTDGEKWEYLHWFSKFKYLEEVKDRLDTGMYEILHKFNRLPLSSHSSCTGHIVPGTNRLEEDWFPALTFVAYKDSSSEEKEVQQRFLSGLNDLSVEVCTHLGIEPYSILDLRGEGLYNGQLVETSAEEALTNGADVHMYLDLQGEPGFYRGRETLSAVWKSFFEYLGEFIDSPEQLPDLENGNIFIKYSQF